MRILLIGGTGFIGPHIVRELVRQGHDVTVYSRGISQAPLPEGVGHIAGDRNELQKHLDDFRRAAPDVVVDLITSSGRQAQALMDAFRGIARRMVLVSSGDVYRACGILHGSETGPLQALPLTEESELRTSSNVYRPEVIAQLKKALPWLDDEYDKIPAERTVMSDPQLPGTVLRLPMVYGPRDFAHRLFPYLKRMDDRRPAILIQEDAARWRGPRGYVENVAAAIALATVSENAARQIYNVAEPESFSETEWIAKIAAVVGWNGAVIPVPKEITPPHLRLPYRSEQHWIYSTAKIREQLGFAERIDPDTALARTIAWERENPPAQIVPPLDYAAEDTALSQWDAQTAMGTA